MQVPIELCTLTSWLTAGSMDRSTLELERGTTDVSPSRRTSNGLWGIEAGARARRFAVVDGAAFKLYSNKCRWYPLVPMLVLYY